MAANTLSKRARFEHAEPWIPCALPGCSEKARPDKPICAGHWKQLPEDIQERLHETREAGGAEWHAALHAAQETL